jgi:hypothetical protein
LPEKKREVHFITSLNIFSVTFLQFGLPLIWTWVPTQLVRISEVLLYIYCHMIVESRIVERVEMVIARQRHSKHFSAARDADAATDDAVFSVREDVT